MMVKEGCRVGQGCCEGWVGDGKKHGVEWVEYLKERTSFQGRSSGNHSLAEGVC